MELVFRIIPILALTEDTLLDSESFKIRYLLSIVKTKMNCLKSVIP